MACLPTRKSDSDLEGEQVSRCKRALRARACARGGGGGASAVWAMAHTTHTVCIARLPGMLAKLPRDHRHLMVTTREIAHALSVYQRTRARGVRNV